MVCTLGLCGSIVANPIIYRLVPSSSRFETRRWIDFLVVIMASGIARGRVRSTTTLTVEPRKMATILQIIGWQRHAALVYLVLFWYMTLSKLFHIYFTYDFMLWSIDTCQISLSADQYHLTTSRAQVYSSSRSSVLFKLTADRFSKVC